MKKIIVTEQQLKRILKEDSVEQARKWVTNYFPPDFDLKETFSREDVARILEYLYNNVDQIGMNRILDLYKYFGFDEYERREPETDVDSEPFAPDDEDNSPEISF